MSVRGRTATLVGIGLVLLANLAIGVAFLVLRPSSNDTMVMPAHPMAMTGRTMSASSCDLVSTAQLTSIVGQIVQSPSPRSTPRETVCRYPISSSPQRVRITYSMFVSPRGFEEWANRLEASGRQTRHLCGIGDTAYLATIPSHHGTETALSMLVGSTQVLIEAPASGQSLSSLAHDLAPAI